MLSPLEQILREYVSRKARSDAEIDSYGNFKVYLQGIVRTKYDPNWWIDGDETQPHYDRYVELMKQRQVEEHEACIQRAYKIIYTKMSETLNYNTQSMKSDKELFKLDAFSRINDGLTDEDRANIYNAYKDEYKKRNHIRDQDIKALMNRANERIFDEFLDDVQPVKVNEKTFKRFIEKNIPEAKDHVDKLYSRYVDTYKKQTSKKATNDKRLKVIPNVPESPEYVNPFKRNNPNLIADRTVKPLKTKLSRPTFAFYPYSWEMDHLQFDKLTVTYLFFVNVNTRYLYCFKVNGKTVNESTATIRKFIKAELETFNHPVKNIKCDGDEGFKSIAKNKSFPDINFYIQSSAFSYHNKIVDAAMRTMRNAVHNINPDPSVWNGRNDAIIQHVVSCYNSNHHRMINTTPIDMHTNIDLEWKYIREMTEELNDVKRLQIDAGLHSFKPGDILMLHLDNSKTADKFAKRRRNFMHYGKFIKYQNGNVVVKVLGLTPESNDNPNGRPIEIPIFYASRYQ